MARDIEQEVRSYSFRCRQCTSEWVRTYGVTIWLDEDGVEHEGFVGAGIPVPDPTTKPLCVSCGNNRVTVRRLRKGHPVDSPERAGPEGVASLRAVPMLQQRKLLQPRTRAFP
jgi:hypothetical protein